MPGYISLKIDKAALEGHIKRICKRNLKIPANICTECPFLGPIVDIMEERGWEYNRRALSKYLREYSKK